MRHRSEAPADHGEEATMRDAYGWGRRDESRRHRSSWLLASAVGCLAVVGAITLCLSLYKGSFAAGGSIMDRHIASIHREGEDRADLRPEGLFVDGDIAGPVADGAWRDARR